MQVPAIHAAYGEHKLRSAPHNTFPLVAARTPARDHRGWAIGLVAVMGAMTALGACGGGTSSTTNATTAPPSSAVRDCANSGCGATTTQSTATSGAAATVTTADGFRYRLAAGKPTLVTQYGSSGGGTPVVASPGMDFIRVTIAITNLQTDRPASIETPLEGLKFAVPQTVAASFGTDPSGFSAVTECDPAFFAGAGAPPPANCILRSDPLGYHYAYDEHGDAIDLGSGSVPPIDPGKTAKVTIYSDRVLSGSPLESVLVYYGGPGMTAVPLP